MKRKAISYEDDQVVRNLRVRAERAAIARLTSFASRFTYCPCCGSRKCEDGCTLQQDHPEQWETMMAAREALGECM